MSKLSNEDIEDATTLVFSNRFLLQRKKWPASVWVSELEAEAKRYGVRTREKSDSPFKRWRKASTALGWVIVFKLGFSELSDKHKSYRWAHEMHHIRWQRAMGRLRWIWRWLSNPSWRWVFEMGGLLEEFRMRALVGAETGEKYRRKRVEAFVRSYMLEDFRNVEEVTGRLLDELLTEYGGGSRKGDER